VGYSAVKCANRGTGGYGFFHLLVCVSDHVLCFPFETTPWPCCCLVYGVGGLGELKYPLVSDLKKEISDAYGVLTGAWQAAVGPLVVCLACCACNNARHMLRHLLTTDAVWAHSGGGGGRGLTIAVRRPALQLCGKCHFTHQDVTATAIPAAAAAAVFTPSVALSLHAPSREACGAQHAVNYSSTATE
jgi:hypothetical protein